MSTKIKKPVTRGVAKVPMVMQMETLECGAASLTMILGYYEKFIPLEQVRVDCGVSRDGSSALNIVKAARYYGLEATPYKMEVEELIKEGSFPCIIHWNFNHFVVLDGFKKNKAYINDPGKGTYCASMDEFDSSFTGICLTFKPSENFVPSGKKKKLFSYISNRLKGSSVAIFFALITGIIGLLLHVINPALSKVFLDRLLTNKNPEWLVPFLTSFAIFGIVQLVTMAIKINYNTQLSRKMEAVGKASFFWKVLKLPMVFFSQRMPGDILDRQNYNGTITNTVINTLTPLLLQSIAMIFYLYVMLRYNILLASIGIFSVILNTIIYNYVSQTKTNNTRASLRDSANLNSSTMSGINMIDTIKASGAENGFLSKWTGYLASVNYHEVKNQKITAILSLIPEFISSITNYLVLIFGVFLTMQGKFTLGLVMAFQGYMNSFMEPATNMSTAMQTLQEMSTQIERIDDVMNYKEESVFAENITECQTETEIQKLNGSIELKNIVFGYSPLSKPSINDFSLSVKPGESVAIIGSSGCGKSTIAKLITGLYKPWSGQILFGGKSLDKIDSAIFHSSVGIVDQDIILFNDTISNNIKMWDSTIEDFEVTLACRDAQLHEDIMQRPMGYQNKLTENGNNLSGGQRQRLEIARVLAQDPTIIIMDEATSALDAKTEYEVVKAIKDRGITSIVVAHRLSTIRSCDKIIVMKDGTIMDSGTHEKLFETNEFYRSLIISE